MAVDQTKPLHGDDARPRPEAEGGGHASVGHAEEVTEDARGDLFAERREVSREAAQREDAINFSRSRTSSA